MSTMLVCSVCNEEEAKRELLTDCDGCGELYHLNPYQTEGKDCGDAWLGDSELPALQFYCQRCIDRVETEQRQQWAEESEERGRPSIEREAVAPTVNVQDLLGGFPGGRPPTPGDVPEYRSDEEMPDGQELIERFMRALDPDAIEGGPSADRAAPPAAGQASTPPPRRQRMAGRPAPKRRYRRID
jgi:hypothetical protein